MKLHACSVLLTMSIGAVILSIALLAACDSGAPTPGAPDTAVPTLSEITSTPDDVQSEAPTATLSPPTLPLTPLATTLPSGSPTLEEPTTAPTPTPDPIPPADPADDVDDVPPVSTRHAELVDPDDPGDQVDDPVAPDVATQTPEPANTPTPQPEELSTPSVSQVEWRTDLPIGSTVGSVLPATLVRLANGSEATLEQLADGKPLLLYFFATW